MEYGNGTEIVEEAMEDGVTADEVTNSAWKSLATRCLEAIRRRPYQRTEEHILALYEFTEHFEFLRILWPEGRIELCWLMTYEEYFAGDKIFSIGDEARKAFIILEGEIETQDTVTGEVLFLTSGDYFGDDCLVKLEPRKSFAKCVQRCDLLVIDRRHFIREMKAQEVMKQDEGSKQTLKSLLNIDELQCLDPSQLSKLSGGCVENCYSVGTVIYQAGAPADNIFLLVSGQCKYMDTTLHVRQKNMKVLRFQDMKAVDLTMIPEGQMFGEIEVLFKCPRLFTAVAISSVRILAIPKKDFFARLSMQVIDDLRRLARKKFRWLLDRAKVLEEQSQEDHKTVGRLQFMSPPEEKSQEVEEKPDPEFIRNWWKGTPGRLWFPKNGTGALDSIIEQENIAYGRAAARVRPPSVVDLINRAPLNALLVNAEQAQQKLAESIATLVMNEEDEFTANTFITADDGKGGKSKSSKKTMYGETQFLGVTELPPVNVADPITNQKASTPVKETADDEGTHPTQASQKPKSNIGQVKVEKLWLEKLREDRKAAPLHDQKHVKILQAKHKHGASVHRHTYRTPQQLINEMKEKIHEMQPRQQMIPRHVQTMATDSAPRVTVSQRSSVDSAKAFAQERKSPRAANTRLSSPHSPKPQSPTPHIPKPQSPTSHSPKPYSTPHSPKPQSPTSHSPKPQSPTPHSPKPPSPAPREIHVAIGVYEADGSL